VPVADETFFNAGAVTGKLGAMQKHVEELERMLDH
jgi:hypothetical protein